MMKNRGLALKLALLILTSITIIFSFVFVYNYFFSRQIITNNIEENANSVALATVNRIDAVLRALEKVPENLAYFLESSSYDSRGVMELIRSVIEHNPEIYGATIAFEPYAYDNKRLRFAPYYFKSEGKVEFTYILYEYFYSDWYQIPKVLERPIWTEPYYDVGAGEIVMATYSVPFYRTVSGEEEIHGDRYSGYLPLLAPGNGGLHQDRRDRVWFSDHQERNVCNPSRFTVYYERDHIQRG